MRVDSRTRVEILALCNITCMASISNLSMTKPTFIQYKLIFFSQQIWAGSKQGKIHLFDCKTCKNEKELSAHDDAVRAMCKAENRYVITGAGSRDGKVAVWRASMQAIASMRL